MILILFFSVFIAVMRSKRMKFILELRAFVTAAVTTWSVLDEKGTTRERRTATSGEGGIP